MSAWTEEPGWLFSYNSSLLCFKPKPWGGEPGLTHNSGTLFHLESQELFERPAPIALSQGLGFPSSSKRLVTWQWALELSLALEKFLILLCCWCWWRGLWEAAAVWKQSKYAHTKLLKASRYERNASASKQQDSRHARHRVTPCYTPMSEQLKWGPQGTLQLDDSLHEIWRPACLNSVAWWSITSHICHLVQAFLQYLRNNSVKVD